MQHQPIDPKDDQFRDYGNKTLKLMGKLISPLHFNGWTTQAAIKVIGGCRASTTGRDLMPELFLMLVQAPAEQGVLNIQEQTETEAKGNDLHDW